MLKIAIDGNEANIKNRVGSNVYAFEIILGLEKIAQKRNDLEITVLLSEKKINDLPRPRRGWNYQVITPKKLWTQWALPIYLYKNQKNFDVFFTPGHYAPRICPIPYVSSVMDLAFLQYPKQFRKTDLLQLKNWTSYSVKNAKKIVTISEFSKTKILETYKKKAEDIIIAYPSITNLKPKITKNYTASVFEKFELGDKYLLSLSTLQPRKNLIKLIEAFNKVSLQLANNPQINKRGRRSQISQVHELKLVIAGKIGWLADGILQAARTSPFNKNIILTGFINEKEKRVLFENSLATVSISPYEGFGIPALETLQYASIPIVANNSSLPEVVGTAGILIDPHDLDSITSGIETVLNFSAKKRAEYKKLGRDQIKKFSWEKSAKKILETLEQVAKLKH